MESWVASHTWAEPGHEDENLEYEDHDGNSERVSDRLPLSFMTRAGPIGRQDWRCARDQRGSGPRYA